MFNILITQEMQVKTTMSTHETPASLVKVNQAENVKCWQGHKTTETFKHYRWGCKNDTVTLENSF